MFNQLVEFVRRLFGRIVGQQVQSDLSESERHKTAYENTAGVNFDAIFAESLSRKAVTDCDLTITAADGGESRRSLFVGRSIGPVWEEIKNTVSQALGKGGKFLIPYVDGDRVYVDRVDQNKVAVIGTNGAGELTALSVNAEMAEVGSHLYLRIMDYSLEDRVLSIRTRAVSQNGAEVPLNTVAAWADIPEEIVIGNVDQMPVGFLKCPRDSRRERYVYGVPITFGAEDTVAQLNECIHQIRREYKAKDVKVFADSTLFGKDDKIGELFKLLRVGGALDGKPFYEVFDPAIRDSAYYVRYSSLCAQLEKEVGTSAGILTKPENKGSTAYEIRSENYDTYCWVDDIRKAIEGCLKSVAYGVDLYAEFFGLTPAGAFGDYRITYDWDTSLIESSTEKFSQLSELESRGLISGARLNSYVTGQSLEDAQAEIDAVAEENAKTAGELLPEEMEPDVG